MSDTELAASPCVQQVQQHRGEIMKAPITSKSQMYSLLSQGALGNALPQWFDTADWLLAPERHRYPLWGIRGLAPGHPHTMLDVPTAHVVGFIDRCHNGRANITPMIDRYCTFRAHVLETPAGLNVWCVLGPARHKWREAFAQDSITLVNSAGWHALRQYLNSNSLDDLRMLLELYPEHVVELTACDRCIGLVPLRNAVIWEVRCTTGEYERDTWSCSIATGAPERSEQ